MMPGCVLSRALVVALCVLAPVASQLTVSSAVASTVVPMNVSTLSGYAGQVIVADVASVRSYWGDSPRRIETLVSFENVTYLKGRLADANEKFSLVVPGGVVGKMRMRICCTPVFRPGERHLLFLLPSYKTFPTVGLGQGAFRLIADDNGEARVYQHGIAVTGFDAESFVRLASGKRPNAHHHVVAGDRARLAAPEPPTPSDKAMRYEDFVAHLKPILAASRDHNLSEPAGKRVLVELRSVPLKTAPASRQAGTLRSIGKVDEAASPKTRSDKTSAKPSAESKKRPGVTPSAGARP